MTKRCETELREVAARGAAELDGATALDVLRWTDETFGGVRGSRGRATCDYVVASSMQGRVALRAGRPGTSRRAGGIPGHRLPFHGNRRHT